MSTAYVAPGPLTPILTNGWGEERSWTLDSYRSRGGYQGLEKARTMEPADIVQASRTPVCEAVVAQASPLASSGPSCPRPTAAPATSW